MQNIQLSGAKSALLLLFICCALVFATKTSTLNVEASASNAPKSVAQPSPTTALTQGRVNGKIVFTSNRNPGHPHGGLNLWTMSPDGSNPTQLTDESMRGPALPSFVPVYDGGPKWSPDGTRSHSSATGILRSLFTR